MKNHAIMMLSISTISLCPPNLVEPDTYRATPFFRQQLETVGIPLGQPEEAQDPQVPADHLHNLNATMQHFCFQKDFEFWKNGNTGKLTLNPEQAHTYLKAQYKTYQDSLPTNLPQNIDVVIPGGVRQTVIQRLHTYAELIRAENPSIATVHFLVKEEHKEGIEELLKQEYYANLFKNVKVEFSIGNEPHNVLVSAAQKANIANHYIVISDPIFAEGLKTRLSSVLKDRVCHGHAHVPIKNYEEHMSLYGYTAERLGSKEKAVIAWALSDLNFKARALHALEQKRLKQEQS